MGLVGERFAIRGAAITAHDPAFDPDGRVAQTALGLIGAIARVAGGVASRAA